MSNYTDPVTKAELEALFAAIEWRLDVIILRAGVNLGLTLAALLDVLRIAAKLGVGFF